MLPFGGKSGKDALNLLLGERKSFFSTGESPRSGSEQSSRNLFLKYCTLLVPYSFKPTISLLSHILAGNLPYSETNGNSQESQ